VTERRRPRQARAARTWVLPTVIVVCVVVLVAVVVIAISTGQRFF
jgi:hypothetical protein